MNILEARNIKKVYKQLLKPLHVLKGVDFEVREGEVVAIVGPSGAGKSTLLHILGGLDKPNDGFVTLDGEEVYRLKEQKRAKMRNEKVGFIFQFYHLLPEFSALENVVLPALIKEDSSRVKRFEQRGKELLERVGLKERAQHKPNQLSGGEQQRVAIARALMNEPKVILCDEPTGNLDSESGAQIVELLIELNTKNNQTLIIVTHDEDVARRAHRIVHIRDGQIT